jgi:hypothetical protein
MRKAAGWIVELEGHSFDLMDVETEFKTGAVRVAASDGRYLLDAAPLAHLAEDQSATARQRAEDVVECVNEVMRMLSPVFRGVEIAAVLWLAHGAPGYRIEFEQASNHVVRIRERHPTHRS